MNVIPSSPSARAWRDPKRYLWLFGLAVPLFPFLGGALVRWTGLTLFWYLGPLIVFVLVPLLDVVVGVDRSNPPEEATSSLESDPYYRWITFLFLPVQYAAFLWSAWLWSGDTLSFVEKFGLALTVGTVAGVGINTAHELGHKREPYERWFARIALAQSFYGHFYVEHNRGHHTRVATPEDPASSRLGESLYAFLPRTVVGSLRSAWRIEKERLARRGKTVVSFGNNVLNAWLLSLLLWGGLIVVFGPTLFPFLLIQAALGVFLLEVVNYLEHYGLLRRTDASGRAERVRPEHSWNSNHVATNVLLYHLQRHSDHHANPARRYQTLREFAEAPALPTGYAGMILLALVPPLWRRVMDPRVVAHLGGDLARANVLPSKRASLLAKYARPVTQASAQ